MPQIKPIHAVTYAIHRDGGEVSPYVAPPYDVLTKDDKRSLLQGCTRNIVAIDLPHVPAGQVGPDETYARAAKTMQRWLEQNILVRRDQPALFVYQQTYQAPAGPGAPEGGGEKTLKRRGLFANVALKPFGPASDGTGGVHPHEKTHSGPKEDRLKLMQATGTQLSPIFGLYSDPAGDVQGLLEEVIQSGLPDQKATTPGDGVLHEVWTVAETAYINRFSEVLTGRDLYIADGHHRYTTALNYHQQLAEQHGQLPADHPAKFCMFVLVSMQDPGMIVLPTHRALGGMTGYSAQKFTEAAKGKLDITPFPGRDLSVLEAALSETQETGKAHAIGLYMPDHPDGPLAIATTPDPDPLASTHPDRSPAWRQLDVAIVQQLIVEDICQTHFCDDGQKVAWKFPHTLDQLRSQTDSKEYQLGLVLQATPLEAVRQVCEDGELMPQKSTFFYPKLATGLVINPLK